MRLSRKFLGLQLLTTLCAGSALAPNAFGIEDEAVIQLDETVISGNQELPKVLYIELPKVLYIVPWQQPDGLPDIQVKHDFTESDVFRKLYPPAYRRELNYFQTLHARGVKTENPEK